MKKFEWAGQLMESAAKAVFLMDSALQKRPSGVYFDTNAMTTLETWQFAHNRSTLRRDFKLDQYIRTL